MTMVALLTSATAMGRDYQCMSNSKHPESAALRFINGENVQWMASEDLGSNSPGRFTKISHSLNEGIAGERIYRLTKTRNKFGEYMYLSIPQKIVNSSPSITVSLFQECKAEICDDPGLLKQFNCKLLPAK
jgi:hypothetical protein